MNFNASKKDLKKYDYNIVMPMNTATLPKKDLKKYDYNIVMPMNTATLPKKGLKKYDYNIDMERKDLKKLTKGQLIELLLKQEIKKPNVVIIDDTKPTRLNRPPPIQEVVQRIKPTPPPRTGKLENVKPKPVPRNSVKQFGDYIIPPPEQLRDGYKPIPKPRTDKRQPLQLQRYPKPTRIPPSPPEPLERFRNGYKPPKPTRRPPPIPKPLEGFINRNKPQKPTRRPPNPPTSLPPILERFRTKHLKPTSLPPILKEFRSKPLKPTRRPPILEKLRSNSPTSLPPILEEFRSKPIKPTRRPPPIPIGEPKVVELKRALRGYAKSLEIQIVNHFDPLIQFKKTENLIGSYLKNYLTSMKGIKFTETLEITFEKTFIDHKSKEPLTTYKSAFFNSKPETITNENDIEGELDKSRHEILFLIDKWISEGSAWTIDQVSRHFVNIVNINH